MPTNTYVALRTTTLGTAVNSVTFDLTGITGYTDIKLVMNASYSSEDYTCFQFNGDTATNYSETPIVGNGSSVSSGRAANRAFIFTQAVAGTSVPFMVQSNFMNYSNSTTYKTVLSRSDCASRDVTASVGLWRSTAAITSIKVYGLTGANFQVGSTFSLYGIQAWAPETSPKATGGYVYQDSTYWYHSFPFSGTFTPNQSITADVLVVAGGGGGGGAFLGGGGGAGGVRAFASQSLTATGYTCTVGAGGAGGAFGAKGSSGATTTFNTSSSSGGGGGGTYASLTAGVNGGSGGGGSGDSASSGGSGNTGSYSPVEGFAGGGSNSAAPNYGAGGGGGASAVGASGTGSGGGAGGAGTDTYNSINFSTWLTATGIGSSTKVAGGGGGATAGGASTVGAGGVGGGGAGGDLSTNGQGVSGLVSTGAGGGGSERGGGSKPGGNGGSGVIIVRYAK